MSTPAAIAIRSEAGQVYGIYLHWDGDPDCAGQILANHYAGRGEVWKLIRLGNLSILGSALEPQPGKLHGMSTWQRDVCLAYKRDCFRADNDSTKYDSVADWKNDAAKWDARYVYLYEEAERQWYYAPCRFGECGIRPAGSLKLLVANAPEPKPDPPVLVMVMHMAA